MRSLYSLLVIAILCAGCGPHKIYEGAKQVEVKWTSDVGVDFAFNVNDTTNAYNVILELTHEESFGFQNLYTKIVTDFPDGTKAESVVSLDVRKKSGATQGKCSGTTCTVPFLIQEDAFFEQMGQYRITLFQHSRMDTIRGVINANLIVLQTDKG